MITTSEIAQRQSVNSILTRDGHAHAIQVVIRPPVQSSSYQCCLKICWAEVWMFRASVRVGGGLDVLNVGSMCGGREMGD